MPDARGLAVEVLYRCMRDRAPCEPLLAPMLARSQLSERDRRLATQLVQTAQRWRGRADHVLDGRLRKGLRSLDPRTLVILRVGYIQLFHLDQIPPHAAVHSAVDLAWRLSGEGKARLVNKILRGLISQPPSPAEWQRGRGADALAGELSHPSWLIERWLRRWDEAQVRAICNWNNSAPDLHLRLSRGAEDRARVSEQLAREGIEVEPGAVLDEALRVRGSFDVRRHPLLADGSISVQDESQMIVGRLWPEPQAGPVLDLCAAPGTKTAHLAERSPDEPIYAVDPALRRARRIAETAARIRRGRVHAVVADGRQAPFRGGFRRVLIDAPCTSLGVLRRRPDARWLRAPGEVADAARLQGALLDAAAELVAAGGWLLYSVCSLEPEETVDRAREFLERQMQFSVVPIPEWIPEEIRGESEAIAILPGTLGMEGLYAVLFQRGEGAEEGAPEPPGGTELAERGDQSRDADTSGAARS